MISSKPDSNRASRGGTLALAAVLLLSCGTVLAQVDYRVVDLGVLDGRGSFGFDVNFLGHAVGASTNGENFSGFFWDGAPAEIAPLADDLQCYAFAVNENDRVAAMSYDLGEVVTHGLLWDAGTTTSLGDFAPRGINDSEMVAGFMTLLDPDFGWIDHAAWWQAGTTHDLGTLGGHFSYAADVNASEMIVGWSRTPNDIHQKACSWLDGVVHDLGTFGGMNSQAIAINARFDAVGWAETAAGDSHACLYLLSPSGGAQQRIDLGTLDGGSSYAYGLNDTGEVVGTSDARAFLWRDGQMTDLNERIPADAGWRLDSAWAINAKGRIVGSGTHDGQVRAFMLIRALLGDFDGDDDVDLADLAFLLSEYGCTSGCLADLDGDGDVDLADLAALLANYGDSA